MLNGFLRQAYSLGRVFGWTGTTGMAAYAAILSLDFSAHPYTNWPDWIKQIVEFVNEKSFYIWIILSLMLVFGVAFRYIGKHWVWDTIVYILNEFQKKAFKDLQEDRNDHHRVTLFRYKRFVWFKQGITGKYCFKFLKKEGKFPWSGWLVPELRSGNKSLGANAIFCAFKSSARHSEGVVGYAWDSEQPACVNKLPAIKPTSGFEKRKSYAKKTFCPMEMIDLYLKTGNPLPRSIGAIPVYVKGTIWGVLVLDSQADEGVTIDVLKNFTLTVGVIGQLLERV